MPNLFVTGTDTGVGKTVVCGLLAGYWAAQGRDVITQKWIQSGVQDGDEDIDQHDGYQSESKKLSPELKPLRVPYRLALPASPHLAAAAENTEIDPERIKTAYRQLEEHYETVIVEGIGGLLVPLDPQRLVVDLVVDLDLPVLVVVANKLGAINHTLLTVEALQQRRLKILGLIFNEVPQQDPQVTQDNPRIIQDITQVPALGHLPWTTDRHLLIDSFAAIGTSITDALT